MRDMSTVIRIEVTFTKAKPMVKEPTLGLTERHTQVIG